MRSFSINTFYAFGEDDLSFRLRERAQACAAAVRAEQENYLMNVNREDYVAHVVQKFTMPTLLVQTDNMTVTPEEMLVSADLYPRNFHVYAGKSYPRLVLTAEIPINDPQLIRMRASTWSTGSPAIWTDGRTAKFAIVDFDQGPEEIKRQLDHIVAKLRTGAERLNADIAQFNQTLRPQVEQVFDARRAELLKRRDFLAALNVPIKATNQTASTYAAPIKRTPVIAAKPSAPDKPFKPDPTLDQLIYDQVLKIIHGVGVAFEQLPATYTDKGEEDLRDHFLLALAPNFSGATTGETFNKGGKTDILLRHETSNLFVGECKFWKGAKVCLDTITQLISYLTWRDSKAAVMFFVRNVSLTEVLSAAKAAIPQHPNYLGAAAANSETWLNYRFHVNGDRSREIKVAVLFFHFPTI